MDKKEIIWRAAEYKHTEKNVEWYFFIGVAALILIIFSLWQKNFFFAVFILIATVMLFSFSQRRPQIIEFKINKDGVGIQDTFYKYETLESFTIRKRPEHLDEIIFKRKTAANPFLKLPIDSKSLISVMTIIKENIPETEYQESLLEMLIEFLGL